MLDLNRKIEIERGIPIGRDKTDRQRAKWHRVEFPFARMEVGDSFAVYPGEVGGLPLIKVQNLVSGAACSYRKRFKPGERSFTTRQMGDHVRVWRTL